MSSSSPKGGSHWTDQIDSDQVFRLIDSILPFEACLYHQVLPLSLEGSRLKLGMVNLDDSAAMDYVRRILAYMNCSLVPHDISSSTHQAALSAYLHYTGSQQNTANARDKSRSRTIANRIERKLAQEAERLAVEPPPTHVVETNPTLLVDSPEELEPEVMVISLPPAQSGIGVLSSVTQDALSESPVIGNGQTESLSSQRGQESPTFLLDAEENPLPPRTPAVVPVSTEPLPVLEINAKHLTDPVEVLANLPPATLLQELLARVLLSGIGRLYFERQPQHGRILWSQDGVPQSMLENLPLETLQGVLNELKLLTRLPLIPVQKPRQVEIERMYLQNRLLLRLRVMPARLGEGEEATLQVLRGAALRFYQQQQIANLSRDVLGVAQELQRKVDELQSRTRSYPVSSDQLSILPALDRVLKNVAQQLETLKLVRSPESPEKEG
jgi:type II secretory ATPase GspE/PulE/Tfp pilus assembly ATPase PilB-like protein